MAVNESKSPSNSYNILVHQYIHHSGKPVKRTYLIVFHVFTTSSFIKRKHETASVYILGTAICFL